MYVCLRVVFSLITFFADLLYRTRGPKVTEAKYPAGKSSHRSVGCDSLIPRIVRNRCHAVPPRRTVCVLHGGNRYAKYMNAARGGGSEHKTHDEISHRNRHKTHPFRFFRCLFVLPHDYVYVRKQLRVLTGCLPYPGARRTRVGVSREKGHGHGYG